MRVLLILLSLGALANAGFIHPSLVQKVQNGEITNGVLLLPSASVHSEAISKNSALAQDRSSKVRSLVSSLQQLSSISQAPLLMALHDLGIETESFWASNMILLKNLSEKSLKLLTSLQGEFEIREEYSVSLDPLVIGTGTGGRQGPQWNIAQIRAPEAWSVTQGEGVVVGVIDTGVNIGHEALKDNYGGAWADPVYNSSSPTDNNGHGTHVLGVVVGTTNGIGVAPGASWVACRGLTDAGSGAESTLTYCAQFFLESDPMPNVVVNAWGGGASNFFTPQLEAWRAAGIIPVFGVGNSGPSCGSIASPGDQKDAFSSGATNQNDTVLSSSRGPTSEGLIKPELVAPGVNILSAGRGENDYVTFSGSSFGTAHIGGAAALVISANPGMEAEEVIETLKMSAYQPPLTDGEVTCGPGPEDYPNNAYGWGRVDAAAALGL